MNQRDAMNVVCWHCWQAVPEGVRAAFLNGTDLAKRIALRQIIEISQGRREPALA